MNNWVDDLTSKQFVDLIDICDKRDYNEDEKEGENSNDQD